MFFFINLELITFQWLFIPSLKIWHYFRITSVGLYCKNLNNLCGKISEITCAYGAALKSGDWVVNRFWFMEARLLQGNDFVVFCYRKVGMRRSAVCYLSSSFSLSIFIFWEGHYTNRKVLRVFLSIIWSLFKIGTRD